MSKQSGIIAATACLFTMTSLTSGQAAWAADAPSDTTSGVLGDIVVTAQKRKENAQRIPTPISSLGAAELNSLNISSAADITTRIPNLRFQSLSANTVNYNIRGVSQNDYADHLEPPVALYQDEAYLATVSQGSLPMFDIQRVEVLRGPQGTLFGRNSTGGAIRFISAEPTKEVAGFLKATVGQDDWYRVEGAVSGPLSDTVQIRVAGVGHHRGGYLENSATTPSLVSPSGITIPNDRDLGGEGYAAGRVTLAWQPSETIDVSLQGRYWKNFDSTTGGAYVYAATMPGAHGLGEYVGPGDDPYGTGPGCGLAMTNCYQQPSVRNGTENTSGYFKREAFGGTLKLDFDLGAATLTSVTDAQHLTKSYFEDADGSPYFLLTDHHTSKLSQFSQEIRATGKTDRFDWTVGAQYLYFITHNLTEYAMFDASYISTNRTRVTTSSQAVFGQIDYHIVPSLTATLGARYTHDRKTARYEIFDNLGSLYDLSSAPRDLSHLSFDDISGKAALSWQASNDLMLYASYNRGIKSGGFAFSGFLPVDPATIPHDKEVMHAFEIGEKLTFLNGAARLNASAFYYDYKNYQAYVFLPITGGGFAQTIRNLDAKVKGFEAEFTVKPLDGLTLSLSGSYLHTRVYDVVLPDGTAVNRRLPQAPRFSGNASLRYERPVGEDASMSFQFDVYHAGAQSFTVLAAETEMEPAYTTGNARLGFKTGRYDFSVFVDNVWNETYRQFSLDLSSLGTLAQVYARPRSVGASLRIDF